MIQRMDYYSALGVIKDGNILRIHSNTDTSYIDYYYYNDMFYHLSSSYIPIYDLPLTEKYVRIRYRNCDVNYSVIEYRLSKRYI